MERRISHTPPRRRGQACGRLLLLLGAALTLAACVTPVIPLPPPKVEDLSLAVSDPQNNLVVVSGKASSMYADAFVVLYNVRTNSGVVTKASSVDGRFSTPPLKALDGDPVDLWVKWSDSEEASTTLKLKVDYKNSKLNPR